MNTYFEVPVLTTPIYLHGKLEGYNVSVIKVQATSYEQARELAVMRGYKLAY